MPLARGPLSDTVIELLGGRVPQAHLFRIEASLGDADPFGADLQLALFVCYELHYRGFADVHPRWEWDPALLHLRGRLEQLFVDGLRRQVGALTDEDTVAAEITRLCTEPAHGTGVSWFLRDSGTWEQMQEYFVHRSLYHLKEGDPHAWVIPRLVGQAKASLVAVEFDEYGGGRGERLHQELFADLLAAAGLNADYLGYLEHVGAETFSLVNLMSLLALHREFRGAAIGHFAATEITSAPGSARLVQALRRLHAPRECVHFYAEHVEADAVHEQVVRCGIVDELLRQEPDLEADVVFGMRAFGVVEDQLRHVLLGAWQRGQSSLTRPLP